MKLPTGKPKSQQAKRLEHTENRVPSAGTPSNGAIIREKELDAETGTRRLSRWRWRKQGLFPRPIRLGPNSIGYFRSEIEQWLRERERA